MNSRCLNRLAIVSYCLMIATPGLSHAAIPQDPARASTGNATLVVDGRVANVFQSPSSNQDFLVQILVQRSEAIHLDDMGRSTRFPAPGEYLYVHVDSSSTIRENRALAALPRSKMYIRAMLQAGDHQAWTGASPDWYQEIGNDAGPAVTNNSGRVLGIATEQVSLQSGRALKVTRVEPDTPAAKAGLEVGDILVAANGVDVSRPGDLSEQVQRSDGTLQLTVRDVRTGHDVPVEIKWDLAMNDRGQRRSLGVTTEIAFFGGKAVLKVVEVTEGSPAQRAGIDSGLIILSADGSPVPKPERLTQAEREAKNKLVLQVVDPKTRVERTVSVDLR